VVDNAFCFSLFVILNSLNSKKLTTNANNIFGKIGRIASEEVVLHFITSKCLPVLLYGLEVCPLSKSNLQSLDFVVNHFPMKLFKTSNNDIISECQSYLCFFLPNELLAKRHNNFLAKLNSQ